MKGKDDLHNGNRDLLISPRSVPRVQNLVVESKPHPGVTTWGCCQEKKNHTYLIGHVSLTGTVGLLEVRGRQFGILLVLFELTYIFTHLACMSVLVNMEVGGQLAGISSLFILWIPGLVSKPVSDETACQSSSVLYMKKF